MLSPFSISEIDPKDCTSNWSDKSVLELIDLSIPLIWAICQKNLRVHRISAISSISSINELINKDGIGMLRMPLGNPWNLSIYSHPDKGCSVAKFSNLKKCPRKYNSTVGVSPCLFLAITTCAKFSG